MMVAIATMLKIYFELFSPEQKNQLTRNMEGSIRVTCRSKIIIIGLIENRRCDLEIVLLNPLGQLTRNLIGSIWAKNS